MKKYNVFSTICLGIFIILFTLMINGVSFGSLGRMAIISMCLIPITGAFLGIKGKNGLLIILNVLAFITIGYLLLLSGMGEA